MAHFEIAADIAMCEHTPKVNLIAYLASSDKFYFDHYKTINFKTKYRVEGGGCLVSVRLGFGYFWNILHYEFSQKRSPNIWMIFWAFLKALGVFLATF